MASKPSSKHLNISKLSFDPQNPRFPEHISLLPAEELIEKFISDERLIELISSIADQGYFAGEPLLVTKEEGQDKYFVIEGNRRLAALKLLSNEIKVPQGRISVEKEIAQAKNRPQEIPCLIFSDRKDILKYLGFRHITGIKSWGAIQKARYLKQIRDDLYDSIPEEEQAKLLAREIGSRADYVAQMLAALNLYEIAEEDNFFNLPGVSPNTIEFSLLSTAIGYSNISSYIGLEDRKDMYGKNINKEKLKNLFLWMFSTSDGTSTIVGESRNIRKLAAIVSSPDAEKQLLASKNLEEAFLQSEGPKIAFESSLSFSLSHLKKAWATFPSLDSAEEGHVENAREIQRLAKRLSTNLQDLFDESDGE